MLTGRGHAATRRASKPTAVHLDADMKHGHITPAHAQGQRTLTHAHGDLRACAHTHTHTQGRTQPAEPPPYLGRTEGLEEKVEQEGWGASS